MKDAYPELLTSMNYISRVCLSEEERFAVTLASGLRTFDQFVEETRSEGRTVIPGDKAFKLYDTFGFPLDLSQELAAGEGLAVDEAGFARELEEQRERARQSWKGETQTEGEEDLRGVEGPQGPVRRPRSRPRSRTRWSWPSSRTGAGRGRSAAGEGEVVLDRTPFYAEAGGQVGDTGVLKKPVSPASSGTRLTSTPGLIAHRVKILAGKPRSGRRVDAVARPGPAEVDLEQPHGDPPPPRRPAPGPGRPRQAGGLACFAIRG